jgi:hydrogenase maturation protease
VTLRTLVAGIGNIFFGDDGFGTEVAHRLQDCRLPEGAHAVDFGIRGVHLAYELLNGYDTLVIVDAVPLGEPAGTLVVLQPDAVHQGGGATATLDSHSMNPLAVLAALANLGGSVGAVYVVGCQPQTTAPGIGLSPEVGAAIGPACHLVQDLLRATLASATAVSTKDA